jgi:hypothetical protein
MDVVRIVWRNCILLHREGFGEPCGSNVDFGYAIFLPLNTPKMKKTILLVMVAGLLTTSCKKKQSGATWQCNCTYQMTGQVGNVQHDYYSFSNMSSTDAATACQKRSIYFQTAPYLYGSCVIK